MTTEIKPLTPEEERDLRIRLGDQAMKPDHPTECDCDECEQAEDARETLRLLAALDEARAASERLLALLADKNGQPAA